tara:strand:+ start:317 stop:883 length:567 start_codon:yes stop_codon:yes gene_type:complete
MIKIGITGSLASGKSTASKILLSRNRALFSADTIVKKLYKNNRFKNLISKKLRIKKSSTIKSQIRKMILEKKINLKKLGTIIHPLVRKEMRKFVRQNKKKDVLLFEIPLLIESKLMKNFDTVIFIKSKKTTRLKRFLKKGGKKNLFNILNNKQLSDSQKIKFCEHVVVNEKNKDILKKKLLAIIRKYE